MTTPSRRPDSAMEVLPVTPLDLTTPMRNIRVRTFFVLDDRLDKDKLRNAIFVLIKDHWRKLGARLVGKAKDGPLVYQVPKEFDVGYEVFRWSCKDNDFPIEKVCPSLGPNLNSDLSEREKSGVRMLPLTDSVDELFRPSQWPMDFADEVDAPFLLMHMSLFTNSTVLAISIPHIIGDQLGLANILRAALRLVDGVVPPPMLGYDDDIMPGKKPFADFPKSETSQKGLMHVRRPLEHLFVLLPFIAELVLEPKEESTVLLFPLSVVQSLRERHIKMLTEKDGTSPDEITNGDILTAVMLKFARMGNNKETVMALSQTVNLRGKIPELAEQEKRLGFIHNGQVYAISRFPFSHSVSIGKIAQRNRQAIKQILEPDAIEVQLAVRREMQRRKQGTHICEPFERSHGVSNWSPAWRDLDFSPALQDGAKPARHGKPLRLVVLGQGTELKSPKRCENFLSFQFINRANTPLLCTVFNFIMCKSKEGYWVDFHAAVKVFQAVKEYLAQDPLLENL